MSNVHERLVRETHPPAALPPPPPVPPFAPLVQRRCSGRGESPKPVVKLPAEGGEKQLCCALPPRQKLQNGLLKQEIVRKEESEAALLLRVVPCFSFSPTSTSEGFFSRKSRVREGERAREREICLRVPPSPSAPPSCPPALSSLILPQARRK